MIDAQSFLNQISATTQYQADIKKPLMGFVDYSFDPSSFPTEWPRVIVDGQGLSNRSYPCVSSYHPQPGDRVVMMPVGSGFVILGAVLDNPTPRLAPGTLVFQATLDISGTMQSIPSGALTPINWDTVEIDLLGGWVGNTGFDGGDFRSRWFPTVAGWYTFSGAVSYSGNATGTRVAYWMRNGAGLDHGYNRVQPPGSAHATVLARTSSFYLNGSTDYIELGAEQNSGVTLTMSNGAGLRSHMEVTYAGPGDLNEELPTVE